MDMLDHTCICRYVDSCAVCAVVQRIINTTRLCRYIVDSDCLSRKSSEACVSVHWPWTLPCCGPNAMSAQQWSLLGGATVSVQHSLQLEGIISNGVLVASAAAC